MTQENRDYVSRWAELAARFGVPTILLVAVLYFVRTDLLLPMVETNRTLSVAYEKLAGAIETQTVLIREIRDEQRRVQ